MIDQIPYSSMFFQNIQYIVQKVGEWKAFVHDP